MPRAARKKMYEVRLFIEVPVQTSAPTEWDWEFIVNGKLSENRTPVTFVLAQEVQVGKG